MSTNWKYAETRSEATHRYPTTVLRGNGYFGDGFRYLEAKNSHEAFSAMRQRRAELEQDSVEAWNGKAWIPAFKMDRV